jgi:hypothetical protein
VGLGLDPVSSSSMMKMPMKMTAGVDVAGARPERQMKRKVQMMFDEAAKVTKMTRA